MLWAVITMLGPPITVTSSHALLTFIQPSFSANDLLSEASLNGYPINKSTLLYTHSSHVILRTIAQPKAIIVNQNIMIINLTVSMLKIVYKCV